MTVENLMKPRYKVIADYPGSPNLGMIFSNDNIVLPQLFYDEDGCDFIEQTILDKYPHLFKPLAWYEERKVEDMPEYVKDNSQHGFCMGRIYKVDKWNSVPDKAYFESYGERDFRFCRDLLPATHEDYLTYINSKTT